MAITDHGNMNAIPYIVEHAKKMQKEGKEFKPVYGLEAYFIPSISDWEKLKEEAAKDKKNKKLIDSESGFSIEDEAETKKAKSELNQRRHMVLLAQNQVGLNNLFQLVSKSYEPGNFYRFPRIDYDMLREHNEGVIASSACMGGVLSVDYWRNKDNGDDAVLNAMRETTQNMIDIFGDRWYIELQWWKSDIQMKLNKMFIKVADELGVKLITTSDSHYYRPDLWKDRELYKRLRPGFGALSGDIEVPELGEFLKYELYPKNGDECYEHYKRYSEMFDEKFDDQLILESIERTHEIAHQRIESFWPDNTIRLPSFVIPEGMTDDEALETAAFTGLAGLEKHQQTEEYQERLKRELKVIKDRGFSRYFLTMKAISDRAQKSQLAGPARGSGGGSLVAYALKITQLDPIKYNLLFSRFLRADATDYPDIDFDVSSPMQLKEDLIKEWGDDCVVPISNWNTLQLRSLIKDISKFYDIPFAEVNKVTGKMTFEATPAAKKDNGIVSGVYTPTFEETMKYSPTLQEFLKKYPQVKTHVNNLYKQVRSQSRHAGGIVVGENLDKHMPLLYSGGIRQSPWSEGQNVRHLEPMGFIKFDILGLSTLRMIEDAITRVLQTKGNAEPSFKDVRAFYDEHLHPDKIDFDNQKIYKNVFHKGKWAGIFQFTESGAQSFCEKAKPTSLIDIAAITSIFRPGPLGAKVDRSYVTAKNNPKDITYIHPIVKEVTKETYGFLIFQEQIALLAHKLGKDINLDEANLLRKLLTKKGTGKGATEKLKIRDKFIAGCLDKSISKVQAQKLWDSFEYFSGYGFNKSHAVGYSILSYQCAWLLNYYPAQWLAAFLNKEPEGRKEKAINIVKNLGFGIKEVDINNSGKDWEVDSDGDLVQPLTSIKGLGDKAMEQIILHRPFNTVEEFLFKEEVSYSKLNKKALDVLVRSGACKKLIDDRFKNERHFWLATANDRPKRKNNLQENIDKYIGEFDFTEEEKIDNIVTLTGLFPFELVLDRKVKERLDALKVPAISEFDRALQVCWFIPREVVEKKTRNGKTFWIVNVIDSNCQTTSIKCWNVRNTDKVHLNRPYASKLEYDEQWGFSTRSVHHNFKLLG